MKMAVLIRHGRFRAFNWWPSLFEKKRIEGDYLAPYYVLPLEMLLRSILTEYHIKKVKSIQEMPDFRSLGVRLIKDWDTHFWDKSDDVNDETLIRGVMYLMASLPDFSEKMKKILEEEMKYDFGEFDK